MKYLYVGNYFCKWITTEHLFQQWQCYGRSKSFKLFTLNFWYALTTRTRLLLMATSSIIFDIEMKTLEISDLPTTVSLNPSALGGVPPKPSGQNTLGHNPPWKLPYGIRSIKSATSNWIPHASSSYLDAIPECNRRTDGRTDDASRS